jgi:phosphonate transport system substrate-binding protein
MLIAKRKHGYQPLVRDSSAGLAGILVVRRDGPVRALADLNGKTLAFPSPNALGASLYMRALLAEKEGLRVQPIYVGTHQNVYRKVLMGEAQAGGGVQATLSKEPETVRSRLRILYTTAEIAPHPLAAHPRVPTAARRKIIEALLAMRADEEGRTLLAAVQIPQPIKADYRRDYEHLARLKLERYAEGWGR